MQANIYVSFFLLPSFQFMASSVFLFWTSLRVFNKSWFNLFYRHVGATFNRGFNRAVGSLLAGIFAIMVIEIAVRSGHVAEPYVIGLSIFLVGNV